MDGSSPTQRSRPGLLAGLLLGLATLGTLVWLLWPVVPQSDPNPPEAGPTPRSGEPARAGADLDASSVPALSARLAAESSPEARKEALDALLRLGESFEEASDAAWIHFERRLADPAAAAELRAVVGALCAHSDAASSARLLEIASRPDVPAQLKRGVLHALSSRPQGRNLYGLFTEALTNETDADLRREAALSLGTLRDPELSGTLAEAYSSEADSAVKQAILGALGQSGDAAVLSFLEDEASPSREKAIRISAAQAISALGTEEAFAALKRLLEKEPDPGVRRHLERWAAGR